jgi:hypothetical protein
MLESDHGTMTRRAACHSNRGIASVTSSAPETSYCRLCHRDTTLVAEPGLRVARIIYKWGENAGALIAHASANAEFNRGDWYH